MWRKASAMAIALTLGAAAASQAATVSKRVKFAGEEWVRVDLNAEGVLVREISFNVAAGIHWNPLRAGKGPQCFVSVKNTSEREADLSVAIALFDENDNLIAATESGHTGSLDPDETAEIKMTFREVNRRIGNARTVHIVLETKR